MGFLIALIGGALRIFTSGSVAKAFKTFPRKGLQISLVGVSALDSTKRGCSKFSNLSHPRLLRGEEGIQRKAKEALRGLRSKILLNRSNTSLKGKGKLSPVR